MLVSTNQRGDEEEFKRSITPANFVEQANADQCTTEEDAQTDVKNQTTIQRPADDLLMSLDGKSFGEDYGNDSSHWRSTAENSVSTARFSDEFKKTTIQLGEAMPIICSKLERTTMMDQERTALKWLTNKDRYRHQRTGYQYPRRRLRYRVGYNVKRSRNTRVLIRGRKRHFDQREGIEDNLICSSATRTKVPKLIDTRVHRQHGSTETCEEVWGNSIRVASNAKLRNTASHHDQPIDSKILSYTGNEECSSGLSQQKEETTIRMDSSKAILPNDSTALGQNNNSCVCDQGGQTTGEVLEFPAGSPSSSNRCFSSRMAKEGTMPSSAMEVNTESHKEITGRQGCKGSDDHPNVEQPILVANGYASEYRQSNKDPTEQNMVGGRMAIIRAFQANKGISDSIVEFLKESNRQSTRKNYDQAWARWSIWCKSQNP
ncbi:hypothetical protein RMATCC62417_05605 [Rhizopus microsporus]|nr:hypothetical protein RMATCC62417_05605 [Rhizopus microsporus]